MSRQNIAIVSDVVLLFYLEGGWVVTGVYRGKVSLVSRPSLQYMQWPLDIEDNDLCDMQVLLGPI